MKVKVLALFCCLATATAAQAQSTTDTGPGTNYKPTAGDVTAEVGINLERGTFLNSGQLRARKFLAEDKAFRIGVSLDYDYEKISENAHRSTWGFSLAPGIEKHFAGTSRLSPYIGVELPLGYSSSGYENEIITVKGTSSSLYNSPANNGSRSNYHIGLNGLAGVDYYFAPRFYAGFEVGAGLHYRNYSDIEVSYKKSANISETHEGYHSMSFSPYSTGGIRLGFVF